MDEGGGRKKKKKVICSAKLTVRRLELYISTNVEAQNSLCLRSATVSLQHVKQKKHIVS